jgi:hypothetical protein
MKNIFFHKPQWGSIPRKASQVVIKIARWRIEFGVNYQSWIPYESKRHRRNPCAGRDNPRNKKAANMTVNPAGGLGRESEPGRRKSPSFSEIRPRLSTFFSSRLVMVDAVQSPGASLAVAAVASEAVSFGTDVAAFDPITLVAALAAAAPFFFTILAEFSGAFWVVWARRR